MDSEPKNYEISYLINPDVAEDEVFGEAGKITGFVHDLHGLVGRIEEPKKRRLAYPINKFKQAYFGWTTFALVPDKLAELENKVRAEKNIVRYVVTEEVKQPVVSARLGRRGQPLRAARLGIGAAVGSRPPKEEDKVKIEELDKRLEEILGK